MSGGYPSGAAAGSVYIAFMASSPIVRSPFSLQLGRAQAKVSPRARGAGQSAATMTRLETSLAMGFERGSPDRGAGTGK